MSRRARIALGTVLAAVLVTAVGVRWLAGGSPEASGRPPAVEEYLPGRAADTYLPEKVPLAPAVVVLVPGGGWRTADRAGLSPLAAALARSGIVAVNTTYRAASSGGGFPQMVADVVCAADFAAERARRAGIDPGRVILLGHSAGAHLAALAALAPDRFRGACPYPPTRIDGLVGLAGVYDVSLLPDVARALFATDPGGDASRWRDGNPLTWVAVAGARPDPVRVLLAHGTQDTTVPTSFTTGFAAALDAAGVPVTVELVEGRDHGDVYAADAAAPLVVRWLQRPDQR